MPDWRLVNLVFRPDGQHIRNRVHRLSGIHVPYSIRELTIAHPLNDAFAVRACYCAYVIAVTKRKTRCLEGQRGDAEKSAAQDLDQLVVECVPCGGRARVHAQFAVYCREVRIHGAGTDNQLIGDLSVVQPLG